MMSFEQFIPVNKQANTFDGYSINAHQRNTGYWSGQINFGGKMQKKLNLRDYKYLQLFTDKQNKLIAIKPTNEQSEGVRKIRYNGGRAFMTCTHWLFIARTELGYPENGKGDYEVIDGGLVVLKKPAQPQSTKQERIKL